MLSSSHFLRKQGLALYALCVVLFSLLLTACGGGGGTTTGTGSSSQTSAVPAPKDLINAGTLVVGSDTTYTPMEFPDPNDPNAYTGFDIDLIKEIGKRLGLQVQIQKDDFATIFKDLDNKRFDVVISSVTVNDKRKASYDFVPYFKAGESLLVPASNPKNLKTTADLCGLKVGVQTGTVEQDDLTAADKDCKSKGKTGIALTVLDSQTDVIQLLVSGRVDATYQDSPVTDYYNKQNPGKFEVGGSIVNSAPYGITIRKNDTEMLNAVQAAFKAVQSDGTYDNLFKKWGFSTDQKMS